MRNPFRYFNSSPEVIRLTVMMYIRYPLSLRQVEDLLFERGIDICHETVRYWWNRFGPMFANGHCPSKFVCFAKTSEPDFVAIDFPAFFRVDLSGSMAAPSI